MNRVLALTAAAMLAAPVAAGAAPAIPMPPGGVSVKGPEKTEWLGAWEIIHSPDEMTDELSYTFILRANETEGEAALGFICYPSRNRILAAYNAAAVLSDGTEPRDLTYRLDDAPPVTSAWSHHDRTALVLADEAQAFIAGLEHHSRLRVRAIDARGVAENRSFDLTGAAAAIARMRTLCAGGR